MSNSLQPHGQYSPWNSPGHNTGVGNLSLLQGVFPTPRSSLGLLHCRRILNQLSHKGSPRILEAVGYPFCRGSSQPRAWTGVSCIAGGFFTNWATRETPKWSGNHSVMSSSLRPGQNTGVGSLSPLWGISPTEGLNPDLPHGRWILYQQSYQGSKVSGQHLKPH